MRHVQLAFEEWLTRHTALFLYQASAVCASVQALQCEPAALESLPELSGRVRLCDVEVPGGEPLSLHFSLPRGYPSNASPNLQVALPPLPQAALLTASKHSRRC